MNCWEVRSEKSVKYIAGSAATDLLISRMLRRSSNWWQVGTLLTVKQQSKERAGSHLRKDERHRGHWLARRCSCVGRNSRAPKDSKEPRPQCWSGLPWSSSSPNGQAAGESLGAIPASLHRGESRLVCLQIERKH